MQAYREIINGQKLAGIVDLPEELRESELELIVFPVERKEKKETPNSNINPEDLPRHKMGRVLKPLDRENIYSGAR
jgi:hypothetical protein